MDNKTIEKLVNETFSGLALFYRDTDLNEQFIKNYQKGQMLIELGFTDMSYKPGGLEGNLRYLIASAFGKDLSPFSADAASHGHVVLRSDSCFKVLDIYSIGSKTQILLLNIPPGATGFFAEVSINVEDQIVEVARKRFDELFNSASLPELQTEGWRSRTAPPIGMSDDGVFFPIEG
jgi:hypothetical protein